MSTRRTFLKAIAGIVAGGATIKYGGTAALQRYGDDMGLCSPLEKTSDDALVRGRAPLKGTDLMQRIYQRSKYTLVGDTNHLDLRLGQYFYSSENISDMAAAGVKHVALEIGVDDQVVLDRIMAEEFTEDEYIKRLNPRSETQEKYRSRPLFRGLIEMKKNGIQVHAIDSPEEEIVGFQEGDMDWVSEAFTTVQKMCKSPVVDFKPLTMLFHSVLNPIDTVKHVTRNETGTMRERKDDTTRHERLLSLTNSEKTVVFMGDGHFRDASRSLKNLLPEKDTTVIQFRPDNFPQRYLSDASFVFMIGNGKVYDLRHSSSPSLAPALKTP